MAIIANGNKGYTQDEFKEYLKTTIDAIVPEVSVSETNAKTSETNAATSATASANSATSSATSAANSEASNQQSKKWAIATDSPDGTADISSSTEKTQSSRSWALYSKDRAMAQIASAYGWLKHAKTHNLAIRMELDELKEMVNIGKHT